MRKIFFALFSVLGTGFLVLALLSPHSADAKTKSTATAIGSSAPPSSDAPAAVVASPNAPSAPTTPSAPTQPVITPATTPVAATSAVPAPAPPPTDGVKAGALVLKYASLSRHGSYIDVYLSIKNNGKGDERLGGAGSTWDVDDIVEIVKNKDGKEQEEPLSMALPAGQTVEFSKDNTWIRVKGVKSAPKNATTFPISFYFRSSPNANLLISLQESDGGNEGIGSSIMGWFKK